MILVSENDLLLVGYASRAVASTSIDIASLIAQLQKSPELARY